MKAVGTQVIETARLVLRPFEAADAPAVFANYGSDPKVNEFISFAPCATAEGAEQFVAMHLEQYGSNPNFYGWTITLDGEVIGSIGLFNVDEEADQCEMGCSLGSRWWGQGYATEAERAVLNYGFQKIEAHRIYASHHAGNVGSGRAMEKIGMKFEGTLRDGQKNRDGSYSDLKLYAAVAEDAVETPADTPEHADEPKEKTITYTKSKRFTQEQVQALFESVGWISAKNPGRLYKALMNSQTVITAWDGDHLVGLIRALDDSEMVAYLHYALVNPEYQGYGIAGTMLEMMKEHYKDYLYINLMPEESKNAPFYEKHDFQVMEDGVPMQICNFAGLEE